jgi:hypothetical protein
MLWCAADPLQLSVHAAPNQHAGPQTLPTRRSQGPCGSGVVCTLRCCDCLLGVRRKPSPVRRNRGATVRSTSADWLPPDRRRGGSDLRSSTAPSVRSVMKCAAAAAVQRQSRTGSVLLVQSQAIQSQVKHGCTSQSPMSCQGQRSRPR